MAKFNYLQNTFSSGELGSKLKARTDAKEYLQGCSIFKNFLPMVSGGAIRRGGTYYGWEIPDASILIPFKFSSGDQYVIALNTTQASHANKIRIYAVEPVVTNIGTLCTVVGTSTLTLIDGKNIYDFQWVQSGDLLFLVHTLGEVQPLVIGRTGEYTFTISTYIGGAFTSGYGTAGVLKAFLSVPYLDYNTNSSYTLQMSATTGTITLTAAGFTPFTNDSVGEFFKINTAGVTTVVEVTAVISSGQVTAEVRQSATGSTTGASNYWARSAWGKNLGYPQSVCIHQQRLIFGGNSTFPNTVWCSNTGNLFLMMQEKLLQDQGTTDNSTNRFYGARADSDPFSFAIAHSEDNAITSLASAQSLIINTTGEEFVASNTEGIFGYRNISVHSNSSVGAYKIKPIKIDNSLFFVSANRNSVYALKYSDEAGSNIPANMSVLNDEIAKYGITQSDTYLWNSIGLINSAYCKDNKTMFFVNNSGKLLSLTFDETFQVKGWAKHDIGNNGSDFLCYSVTDAIIPIESNYNGISTSIYHDLLFIATKRVVNGATKYFVEALMPSFDNDIVVNENTGVPITEYGVLLDFAYISQLGAASVTHGGFSHAIGETLAVIADGEYIGTKTVNGSGQIVLDNAAFSVIAGYNYTSVLKTMPIEAGAQTGSSMPALQRIDRIVARLYKSRGGEFGKDENNLLDMELTTQQTVDKQLDLYSTADTIQQVCIVQDEPYPMTILGIGIRGVTHE